jgi:protein involved in polysaccharide export with SLBB domain
MTELSIVAGAANMNRRQPSRASGDRRRILRTALLAAMSMLALSSIAENPANGQVPSSSVLGQSSIQPSGDQSGSAASTMTDDSQNSSDNRGQLTSTSDLDNSRALSAEQIIDLLQQNPDLAIELKSQVADRLQEQGKQIDANDISDEMLFEQIAANASLRANITTFLRARGYVSDDELQSASSSAPDESGGTGLSHVPGDLIQPGETNSGNLFANSGSNTGKALSERSGLATSTSSMSSAANRRELIGRRNHVQVNASTDVPKVLRKPAPYNLRSMRDLYTQIPDRTPKLERFGSDVFENRNVPVVRGISGGDTPLDVAPGPDYVVGSGDTLTINMWGGITKSFNRVIDREGRVLLPEAGSLQVAGLSLERAQDLIGASLKHQYRDAQVAVTVSRLRSVRVYVVGDVQRPGAYDISSLATPLSALYAAGGPTSAGSLRIARHYRGQRLVEDVDLYDFLLHGIRNGSAHFESGDTLLVPPAGPQVAVSGAIKRPATYELKDGETTLATVIDDAGGFTVAAALGNITIERIDANRQRTTVTLPLAGGQSLQADRGAIATFQVQDGDRIRVEPILPYSQRAIYLEGHVVRPGRLSYTDGMRLSDVLHSYRDLLPEPAAHGQIIRLVPPDLHAETIGFDVPDVLVGNANVDLQPFDTVRIFGRYEVDPPKVSILGQVLHPGAYPLSKGMTAAQLVRMAGGFRRGALLEKADLTSYDIKNGNRVVESLATVPIGAVVAGKDPRADFLLKPGDILAIHQITGWNDIGESITIEGQVRFPGNYGFHDGERLSSVLRRAGGLLPAAYPKGTVLFREQVRDLQQKSREELIRQIEANSASARLAPNLGGGDTGATLQLIKAQQDQVLSDLKSHPPNGRMVIHISANINEWADTAADIELRRGDVLTIPKQPGFVLVTGQVYNATALTFTPGKTAGWYLSHAGGTNSTANRKEIFVIRANGSVIGRNSGGWFDGKVLSTKLDPGDVVVVPQKIIGSSLLWRNLLTTAQLASSIAITAAVAHI